MQDDGNSCVICYEPLCSLPFGTTIPCGHLFHEECFNGWSARNERRNLKCPMCNGICQRKLPFMRIFCNLEANAVPDGGDTSSDEDDEEEGEEQDTEIDKDNSMSANADVIEILVDDDDYIDKEPKVVAVPQKIKKAKPVDDVGSSNSKYRQKAKVWKRKCKQLENQRAELIEKDNVRSKLHRELQEKMKTFDADMIEIEEMSRRQELERAERALELHRSKASSEEYKRTADLCKARMQRAQELLRSIQQSHAKELRSAQSTTLTEVQELQTHHRDLSIENQRLKEAVSQRNGRILELKRRAEGLEQHFGGVVDDSMQTLELDRRKNQKQQLKEMKRFRQEKELEQFNEVARDERKEVQKRMSSKSSALAARIGRASEKRIISKASSILDEISNQPPRKRKASDSRTFVAKKPSIQIQSKKVVASPSSRAGAFVAYQNLTNAAKSKKRNALVQNDIRILWSVSKKT